MQIQIGLHVENTTWAALHFSAIRFEEFVSQGTVALDFLFKNQ